MSDLGAANDDDNVTVISYADAEIYSRYLDELWLLNEYICIGQRVGL